MLSEMLTIALGGTNMIKTLIIENYRSIERLEVELSMLNALIGPNSSGKTNILKALDLIVGTTYPSVRSFNESDFYLHDTSRTILIEVRFQNPIQYSKYDVYGFKLTFDGSEVNYVAIDNNGNTLQYSPSGREIKVTNEMREEVSMMYLPLDRQAYQQITPSQWKIYGKLLKHIAGQIPEHDKGDFKTGIENSFSRHIFSYIQQAEDLLKECVKEQTGLDLSLKLSFIDPTTVLKDVRPRITSPTGFEVDVENEGAGVQSAVAIAIARTYARIVQQSLILAIEEPELYLHPHGCRHFYKILKESSQNGVQIIYSTHERSFVNVADLDSILLVKKENDGTEVYSCKSSITGIDAIKTASKFDEEINEVFFASKVILVEGPDDKIACKLALENLGVELDKYNISVIDCGGNTGIKPMLEILQTFNIDTYVLMDEDPRNQTTQQLIREIRGIIGNDKVFLQSPDLEGIFNFAHIRQSQRIRRSKFTKDIALKVLPIWFKSNTVPQVYVNLKNTMGV